MTSNVNPSALRIRNSNWFYPVALTIAGGLLAAAMVAVDRSGLSDFLRGIAVLTPSTPDAAADMLGVMAGSIIGTAATVFVIAIVTVAHASSNYGPRLLGNFVDDRGNQISLGLFLGAFAYALIVLRAVRANEAVFSPILSLSVAYLLFAVCVAALIWFLNHVPTSIRIDRLVESIGTRLVDAIRSTYPVKADGGLAPASAGGEALLAQEAGYVANIDFDALDSIAREHDATLSLAVRTGDFVHPDLPLMHVLGINPGHIADAVRPNIAIGQGRTARSGTRALMDELVDIVMRSLSPGINDPFTTADGLNWIGAATAELGSRSLHKDVCCIDLSDCRVIPCSDDFAYYVERGFGAVRSFIASDAAATQTALEALENAAIAIRLPDRQEAIRAEAQILVEFARLSLAGPGLQAIEDRYQRFASAVPATPVRAVS